VHARDLLDEIDLALEILPHRRQDRDADRRRLASTVELEGGEAADDLLGRGSSRGARGPPPGAW
jgi:hypothetical protein